jgi:hypothetical protein
MVAWGVAQSRNSRGVGTIVWKGMVSQDDITVVDFDEADYLKAMKDLRCCLNHSRLLKTADPCSSQACVMGASCGVVPGSLGINTLGTYDLLKVSEPMDTVGHSGLNIKGFVTMLY